MRARVALSVGGLLAVAGVLNYVLVDAVAPGFGVRALMVNLAAGVAATLLTIWLTARYEAGIKRIASGLADVARGRRDVRFDVDREPLVANLAHCANDAISALAEPIDPSVGALRVRKRGTTGEIRTVPRPDEDGRQAELPLATSGRVTPLPSTPVPTPTSSARLTPVSEPVPKSAPPAEPKSATRLTPVPPASSSTSDALPPMPEPGPAAPQMDISRAPTSPPRQNLSTPPIMAPTADLPSTPGNGTTSPGKKDSISDAAARQEHFKTVFEEYRASLTRIGGLDEDLTFDAFVETLNTTERALMDRHGCRAVRFSVLVEEGKVQLLPRLVR